MKNWQRRWMSRVGCAALAALLAVPAKMQTEPADDAGATNAKKALAVLDAMVMALGGTLWLNVNNEMRQGHIAAFFHGTPDLGTTLYWDFHQWPDHDRIEYTKHRDVLQFYVGRTGWEVTYRGKKALPKDQLDEFLRRRDHSIETAVKVWLKDPKTIAIYEGQHVEFRHLVDQVTLISASNDSVTIQTDAMTHLPVQRVFEYRDPQFKDKDTDAEEYEDYHTVEGLPTAFSITRYKNGDEVRQYYTDKVEYNRDLPADFWDVDTWAHRIKKH